MENNMEGPELLPCPFCGSDAHVFTARVENVGYHCETRAAGCVNECANTRAFDTEKYDWIERRTNQIDADALAISAWNRRADFAAPSAPAEVEGLVERFDIYLDDFDHLTKMPSADGEWMRYADHATALTALQADNERLRSRLRQECNLGLATLERAEKAETERDAWKSNAEALAEAVSPFADVGVPSDPMSRINLTADREFVIAARESLAANAKLKGEV